MKHQTRSVPILLLLIAFVWPILMVFLLTLIGHQLLGCELTGGSAQQCTVLGLNLGETIHSLLTLTWALPLLAWFPFLWIMATLGLLVLIHHELRGGERLFTGLLSIWYLPIAPSWLASLYVGRLAPIGQCAVGTAGINPCWIFGVNMESAFATTTTVPWLVVLIVMPVSLILSLAYFCLHWLTRPRPRRRRMV